MGLFANKRRQGNAAEQAAARYLESAGYTVVRCNYYTRAGEIDLIVKDDDYLVFAEVKQRTASAVQRAYGRPAAAVNREKRQHILDAARLYLKKEGSGGKQVRFDVIEILSDPGDAEFRTARFEHIQNAFGGNN